MMVTPGQPQGQRPPMRPPVSQHQRMPAMSQPPSSIPQQQIVPGQARMQTRPMMNPQNPNMMSQQPQQQQQMVSQHNPVSSQYQVKHYNFLIYRDTFDGINQKICSFKMHKNVFTYILFNYFSNSLMEVL